MKLFISIALASAAAMANGVIIYHTDIRGMETARNRLEQEHGIPKALIQDYSVARCPDKTEIQNRLVLCAKKKELKVLNSSSLVIKSLAVFKSEKI